MHQIKSWVIPTFLHNIAKLPYSMTHVPIRGRIAKRKTQKIPIVAQEMRKAYRFSMIVHDRVEIGINSMIVVRSSSQLEFLSSIYDNTRASGIVE